MCSSCYFVWKVGFNFLQHYYRKKSTALESHDWFTTYEPPAMRVRVDGYTKKSPICYNELGWGVFLMVEILLICRYNRNTENNP